jgi:DNA mismatch repair protein MutS2
LRGFAQSPLGRARAEATGFFSDLPAVEQELDRVGEALRLLELEARPPLHDLYDVSQEIGAARRGAAVPGVGLLNVAVLCRTVSEARSWSRALPDGLKHLRALMAPVADMRPLLADLDRCLETNGDISDEASPELKQLRARALQLHDAMTDELERMLVTLDDRGLLSDRFVSLRNDRFVIPVKAGSQNEVEGIVHDASHSGFTVFVEPEKIIERGNRLKILRVRIMEEEHRILKELSEQVAQQAHALSEAISAVTTLDVLFGKAAFARRLEAERPSVCEGRDAMHLAEVRHPLLLLSKPGIVANDIHFTTSERCLVLTGPNTGGKTAALKTVGITALMAAAGLYIPARAGSRVPLYRGIYSIIGDNQSLSRALSTFSSHVHEVGLVMKALSDEHDAGEALVLLDELAADTDPRLGSALGQAILETMVARGAWVVLTTHYVDLAALALTDGRFANASFGFDPVRLTPTYRLQRGAPGASNPFEIAQALGLEGSIIERARELAPTMGQGLEHLTKQVEVRLDEVGVLKRQLEEEKRAAEKERKAAVEERRLATSELKAAEARAIASLGEDVKRGQQLVREAVKRLQDGLLSRAKDDKKDLTTRDAMKMVEEVRQDLGEVSTIVAKHLPASEMHAAGGEPSGIQVGDQVNATSLPTGAVGEVLAIDHGKREAMVSLGKLKMRLPLQDLVPAVRKGRPGTAPSPQAKFKSLREEKAPVKESGTDTSRRVDVREDRIEEAMRKVERALDAAIKESVPELVILHGQATGSLTNAIREYLSFSHYVKSYRPGRASEGEEAMTIVDLS